MPSLTLVIIIRSVATSESPLGKGKRDAALRGCSELTRKGLLRRTRDVCLMAAGAECSGFVI